MKRIHACLGLILLLLISALTPLAADAQDFQYSWGHPRLLGNPVFAIEFLDDQTGWAIGGGGEVLRSDNAGGTWNLLHQPGELGAFLYDFLILDAETLVAVGDGPAIWRSTDGGSSWAPITNSAPGFLRDLARIPGGGISAVGEGGALMISEDGGLNWTAKGPGLGSARHHYWHGPDEVYVVGEDLAHRSLDGGENWSQLVTPGMFGMNLVFFTDNLVGYIFDDFNHWTTTDGGDNWTIGFGSPPYSFRVLTVSPTHWLMVCFAEGGELWETTDAGDNWTALDFRPVMGYLCIHQAPGGRIFIGSDIGDLFHSDSLGQNLINATENLAEGALASSILTIHQAPDGTVYAANQPNFATLPETWLRSEDQGVTWQVPDSTPGLHWARVIRFFDTARGIVADKNEIRYTLDGGANWLPSQLPGGDWVTDFATPAADRYFAAAWNPSGGGHLWRSDNGGQSWTAVGGGLPGSISGGQVQFLNSQEGLFLGHLGTTPRLYQTSDGGQSWSFVSTSGLPGFVRDIDWHDTQLGLAAVYTSGSEGVYRTVNGGANWTQVSTERTTKVQFGLDLQAVALGTFNTPPLFSDDDGETWEIFELPLAHGFPPFVLDLETFEATNSGWVFGGGLNRLLVATATLQTEVAAGVPRPGTRLRAFPNPFNPETELRFSVTQAADVRLTVHDIRGRMVRLLHAGSLGSGDHIFRWDGKDSAGRTLPSGVYLAQAEAGTQKFTAKLILIK